jgi:hypothetical protein
VQAARKVTRGAFIALLLGLLWLIWRSAALLPRPEDTAVARGLLITVAAASLVTSTLNDHTEGLLFAWASGILFAGYRRAAVRDTPNADTRESGPVQARNGGSCAALKSKHAW